MVSPVTALINPAEIHGFSFCRSGNPYLSPSSKLDRRRIKMHELFKAGFKIFHSGSKNFFSYENTKLRLQKASKAVCLQAQLMVLNPVTK